jgi:hypothetical protein
MADTYSAPCLEMSSLPKGRSLRYMCTLAVGHTGAHQAWADDRLVDSWLEADHG